MNTIVKSTLKTTLLVGLFISLMAASCKKGGVEPEEVRRTGDGTISFFVDGELWQNSAGTGHSWTPGGGATYSYSFYSELEKDNYTVKGKVWDESVFYNSIFYMALVDKGTDSIYHLQNGNGVMTSAIDPFDVNHITLSIEGGGKTYISKENFGWVKQTVIFSDSTHTGVKDRYGTFEATLFNEEDSTDFIQITDGRWDN